MPEQSTTPVPDKTTVARIDLSPLNLTAETHKTIEAGRTAYLFGVFLDPMIKVGLSHVAHGSMDQQTVSLALSTIAKLYTLSGNDYEQQPKKLTGDDLTNHQRNVLNGDIVLVAPQQELNEENRLAQLRQANETLSELPPAVQAIIAELNYEGFFRPQTMAGGAHTRDRNELDQLLASLGTEQDAMPHLTLTNWAIGQISGGIYSYTSETNKVLKIIDTGSGPGGTVAAITDRLLNTKRANAKGLAITCVETAQGFYDQLELFTQDDNVIDELGLKVKSLDSPSSERISEPGSLTTVKSDALSALKRLDLSSATQDDIIIITGNYSWHRLAGRTKQEIMDLFAHVPNVIFVVGDFAHHGNPVAKQYFCLGANGPLNVGNIGLGAQFIKSGYSLVDLKHQRPTSLDERIARKIVHADKDPDIDGHLWIAYKGKLAEKALSLEESSE